MQIFGLPRWLALPLLLSSLATVILATSSHWAQLQPMLEASSDHILSLDTEKYSDMFGPGARQDYAAVVLLTVIHEDYQCDPCRVFEPHYRQIAWSWKKEMEAMAGQLEEAQRPKLVFTELDYVNGREIFGALQVTQVPYMMLRVPSPDGSGVTTYYYDFNRDGLAAESVVEFIGKYIHHPFTLHKPTDYVGFAKSILGLSVFTAALFALAPYLFRVFTHRNLWATLSMIFTVLMLSGFMWNRIRSPPFMGGGGQHVQWFEGGFQTQYAVETQIMALLYSVCAFAVVHLTVKVPSLRNEHAQRLAVYVSLFLLIGAYSVIMSVFKVKNGAYPFRLLF